MVKFKNVVKTYGNLVAVKNLDLEIPEGELVVLIGPSGCGKTTTLKMVNRLIEPTSGSIFIRDRNVMDLNPVALRREIGYVIQQIGLFPNMTIEQNIDVVPRLLGWPAEKRKRRVYELLEMVGMEPDIYAPRYPNELSGGQQQRIGVLRALAAEPPLILMDEPFGALDPIARESLQDELKSLHSRLNKTTIFVTHDMDEALKLADRVVVMNQGEVVQVATPETLLRKPANDFVASFIGKNRLNGESLQSVVEIMLPDPVTVYPQMGLAEGLALMKRKKVDTVLVVDGERKLVGSVAVETLDRERKRAKTIGEIMDQDPPLATIRSQASAKEAFDVIVGEKLKYLPVVDEKDVLVGLVTRNSMVDALASAVWGDEGE
ncbi:MAG: betaine/proline/choline family ABC transporter ATP-binding protein [Syntrophomonadaceae bacterium]|nr:betaine/proline/choline family ABC transporter ATP-binding protein [Syntrophomonadaceae bacterium]